MRNGGHVVATEDQRGAEHAIEVHEVFQHRDFGCHPQNSRPLPGLTPVRPAPGPAGAVHLPRAIAVRQCCSVATVRCSRARPHLR
jgi:hypothetical protein